MNFFKKFLENASNNNLSRKQGEDTWDKWIEEDKKKKEKELQEKEELEKTKPPRRKIIPYKDLYSLSDDEILEKLHKLYEPLVPLVIDLRAKFKEWMSEEDKEKYAALFGAAFFNKVLITEEDMKDIISGLVTNFDDEDDDDEYEFDLDWFLTSVLNYDELYNYSDQEYFINSEFKETYKLCDEVDMEFQKIFWSAFDIDEDLVEVCKFNEIYNKKKGLAGEGVSKEEQKRWEKYDKAYFYSEKQVKRAAGIFLKFFDQRLYKIAPEINQEEIEEIDESALDYGHVYFIRNKDIYKIGITQNLLQRMDQLKPDELLDSVRCSNYKELEKEIHQEFKEFRIPQTEYFRLNKTHISQVHKIFKTRAETE